MIRAEIIANKSAQDDMIAALESVIPDFWYTLIPLVYGRGHSGSKAGTPVWPEENFVLIAYLGDDREEIVRSTVQTVKQRLKREGIKLFILHSGFPAGVG